MHTLTAADFADTGQWRLIITIGFSGLEAWLENTIHTDIAAQNLCSCHWEADRSQLRACLEEAVFNTPRLLDDFATKIILFDKHTLFIPTHVAEEIEGGEVKLYNEIYVAQPSDVMYDRFRDITAVWSMAPGIKNFLLRTFPGARITCNLLEKVKKAFENSIEPTLMIFKRGDEADFILTEGSNLLAASTRNITGEIDLSPVFEEIVEAYGLSLEQVNVIISES